jgi:hypothetical protein
MSIAARIQVTDQDIRTTSTSSLGEAFGQTVETNDGRTFVLAANTSTSTTLLPGQLVSGAVGVANHINQTGVALSIGAQTATWTIGATAVSVGQYTNGYLFTNTGGTGYGQTYNILSHTAPGSAGSITVNLADQIYVATTTSTKFSLLPNLYSNTVIFASGSSTALVAAGVPQVTVPVAPATTPSYTYYWSQIGGPSAVLANGTPGIGSSVIPSATTNGAVDVDGASSVQPKVGVVLYTAVSTQYYPVNLMINAR